MSEKCNRACWNCWYDEFCDWHSAEGEDACERWKPDNIDTMSEEVEKK